MPQSKTFILAASLMTLALAGCQSGRLTPMQSNAPAPLAAAPAGTVTSGQLPPPGQATSPNQFPEAPGGASNTEMAALDPAAQAAAAATAPEITKSAMLGSWALDTGGSTCQMFLTLTKYGSASRGGTRGCSGPLADMRSWDVAGNQLVVNNDTGEALARLHSTGPESFSGQTVNGQPISLSR